MLTISLESELWAICDKLIDLLEDCHDDGEEVTDNATKSILS